jgi:hypothetical protein
MLWAEFTRSKADNLSTEITNAPCPPQPKTEVIEPLGGEPSSYRAFFKPRFRATPTDNYSGETCRILPAPDLP